MKASRFSALFLCLAILLSLAACGQARPEAPNTAEPAEQISEPAAEPAAEEVPVLDAELLRAQSAGLLPEAWLDDMDAAITFAEYSDITARAVELWDAEKLPEWEEITRLATAADEPMDTEDGYLMLSYLWVAMGKADDWWMSWTASDFDKAPREVQERQLADCSWDYPYFPDWETPVYPLRGNANYMGGAMMFPSVMSPVSGEFVFPYDVENQTLHLSDPLSRDTAVRALLRLLEQFLVELDPDWAQFIPLEEAGTYDRSIVTDALLNAPSELPEVTQAVLPTEWKGAGISARKSFPQFYLHYSETDVRFLAENGFNFTRLFLSFQTLRYPDYEQDARMVNENELRELDQLLAWCMEYGVHLQIAQWDYMDENGYDMQSDRMDLMPQTDEAWALARDYWAMLATRYAGIPSKYLSFDLCNEVQPDENDAGAFQFARDGLASVVAAIREADPERVLLYSQQNNPGTKWTEVIASLGVAIGCHPYTPTLIAAVGGDYLERNPYAAPCWPMPYFPTGEVMEGRARVALIGKIDGAELNVHIYESDGHSSILVYTDGNELDRLTLPKTENGGDRLYTTLLPAGAKEVQLQVSGGYARIDTIFVERDGIKTVIMPSDAMDHFDFTPPLPLVVNGDGTYTNSENRMIDEDYIYALAVKPYRDIADQYGVGFMCNEFGMFGNNINTDINVVTAFHETYLNMLEKYSLGWCYCEEFNTLPKHLRIFYGDESQWAGATVGEVTYTYGDGTSETVRVCKELLDVFRAHTIK